jgi:hypothetical protein
MANPNRDNKETGETAAPDIKALLVEALKGMSTEELREVLGKAGAVPTTMGMDGATLQEIVKAFQLTSATAVRETLRQERVENPNYPGRSVFNPDGVFDKDGKSMPKVKFRRDTYYQNVRLGGELETPEEIALFNAFTEDKSSRDGRWTAEIVHKGTPKERLYVKIPSMTPDERMENSIPMTLVLMELLGGADAVNTETLTKRIAVLEAELKARQVSA